MPVPNTRDQLQANENYYLGKPAVDRISIQNYPSFRAAWADMLRDRNDMLYEVGVDALDSLRGATNVHVFAYPRRYQYLVLLNRNVPALQDPKIRTALNFAIDRERLIREALNGHGTASIGPVSPKQWAVANREIPRFGFDPQRAVTLVHQTNQHVSFKCLVLPDYERLALVVKSQLAEIGVDMAVEETTTDNMVQRLNARDFDAILLDAISGPTMYRLYRFWHSGSMLDASGIGGPAVEAALDQIRHSASDDEYRAGVLGFLRAVTNDPPAIFLAWSEGARAVSSRFQVAIDADRRDPIATVRLWRPTNPLDARRN